MKAKYLLGLFFSLLLICTSCDKDEEIDIPAQRTVLFYFAGDNNLSYFFERNLHYIQQGMLKDPIENGNVLVYMDQKGEIPHLFQLKCVADSIQQIEIAQYDINQNSASAETLSAIIDQTQSNFPAESYGLVLSSHGTGWLPGDLNNYLRSFGQDKQNSHIEINDLSSSLSKYHFDFILFDACYMACAEVAYTLRGCTDYIIASPNEILGDGFPYGEFMGKLFQKEADVIGVANAFYQYYQDQSGSVSVIKTSEMDELASACQAIFKGKTEKDLFAVSIDDLEGMEYLKRNYHALYDFEDYVSHLATPEQMETFKHCLDQAVIYKATSPKLFYAKGGWIPVNKFCGLSIYVPQPELGNLNEWYKTLDWYKDVY